MKKQIYLLLVAVAFTLSNVQASDNQSISQPSLEDMLKVEIQKYNDAVRENDRSKHREDQHVPFPVDLEGHKLLNEVRETDYSGISEQTKSSLMRCQITSQIRKHCVQFSRIYDDEKCDLINLLASYYGITVQEIKLEQLQNRRN